MPEAEAKDESTITELWGIFDPKQSRWTVALDEAGEPRLFCLTEAEAKACAAFQEDAFELDGLEVRRVAVGVNAALVAAAEAVLAWRIADFDDIAEVFHRETGYLRPGKDWPVGMGDETHRAYARAAWDKWVDRKNAELTDQLTAAIAAAKE